MIKKPNLNGPESIPLKEYFKDFMLTVTVFDDKDNVIRKEDINYGDSKHRKWLGRVTFWACNNGYVVETSKAKEKENV